MMPQFLKDYLGNNIGSQLKYQVSYACRYNTKKTKLFVHTLTLPKYIITALTTSFLDGFKDKPVENYDPEQTDKDNIYKFNGEQLLQQSALLNFLSLKTVKTDNDEGFEVENADQLPQSDKINFIISKFLYNDNGVQKVILFFSKHKTNSILEKIYKWFTNEEFKKLEKKELYVFNDYISCFYFDDDYYIYNVDEFHQIFKYWEKLKEVRNKIINSLEQENIISNMEEYKKEFEQHYNLKSMVKIDPTSAKSFVKTNSRKIKKICETNELNLTFNEKKQQFTIVDKDGVTILNRILSERSGHNLQDDFVTFPSFKKHPKRRT